MSARNRDIFITQGFFWGEEFQFNTNGMPINLIGATGEANIVSVNDPTEIICPLVVTFTDRAMGKVTVSCPELTSSALSLLGKPFGVPYKFGWNFELKPHLSSSIPMFSGFCYITVG